jgi:imidazolonepropionase-like amidohydrolase
MSVRIDADLVIPGRGEPLRSGSVVIDGARISYVGPTATAPRADVSHTGPVVMPGMWDCHAHFAGLDTPNLDALPGLDPRLAVLRAAQDAETALKSGFTSIREVGGHGVWLARAIAEGRLAGPTIYGAGAVLSQTAGHADMHSLPLEVVASLAARHLGIVCDGPDDCRKAVRQQLRVNARVIKICASGGVMSEMDHPMHQQFTDEELAAIVDEASRAERVVAAHCHGKPGIVAALRAGCRTIEHGTYLDEEAGRMMVDQGAVLVPTRFVVEQLLTMLDKMPRYAVDKMLAIADRHFEAIGIARQAGVTIAVGTDLFLTGAEYGRLGMELGNLARAGLTPLEAIEAATANGPLTLGPQAPKSGLLAPGYDADVIVVARDPLQDIGVLAEPANVVKVWKGGVLVKG